MNFWEELKFYGAAQGKNNLELLGDLGKASFEHIRMELGFQVTNDVSKKINNLIVILFCRTCSVHFS